MEGGRAREGGREFQIRGGGGGEEVKGVIEL